MIPDPIELMEMRMDRLAEEFEADQKDVPKGSFRCPYCREIREGEPIQANSGPDAPIVCYECLPDDLKAAYDKFDQGHR
jgi:hypothetical protein